MHLYQRGPSYAPKKNIWQRLTRLLLILILLAGLCSAAFLLFFRGYVVDTPDGPRLALPFLAKGNKDQPVFSQTDGITRSDEEGQDVDTLLAPLHAIYLSSDALLDGSAQKTMEAAGCNSAIFDMRTGDGALHYVSDLPTAIEVGASAALPGLNDAIRALNQDPAVYTIARVSCFPDERLTALRPELGLHRPSGALWRDGDQNAWLSPMQDSVQQYLLDICRELSALGFDEVLLVNCAYPVQENLALLPEAGTEEALTATLEGFYQQMRSLADDTGLRLSILQEDDTTDSENALGIQNLESLALYAHRIWVVSDYDAAHEVFASHGLSPESLEIVPILPRPGGAARSWALF